MTNKNNKVMEVPEKIYFSQTEDGRQYFTPAIPFEREFVEYMPVDAFIEKVINFLNYKLDDIVAIQNPDSIIPQHVVKPELIEDFKKYIEEYNV